MPKQGKKILRRKRSVKDRDIALDNLERCLNIIRKNFSTGEGHICFRRGGSYKCKTIATDEVKRMHKVLLNKLSDARKLQETMSGFLKKDKQICLEDLSKKLLEKWKRVSMYDAVTIMAESRRQTTRFEEAIQELIFHARRAKITVLEVSSDLALEK